LANSKILLPLGSKPIVMGFSIMHSRNVVFIFYSFIFPLLIGVILAVVPELTLVSKNINYTFLFIRIWMSLTLAWIYFRVGIAYYTDLNASISYLIPYTIELNPSRKIFPIYYSMGVMVTCVFTSVIFYWVLNMVNVVFAVSSAVVNFVLLGVPLCNLYRKIVMKSNGK
jgi:hypothetical protein